MTTPAKSKIQELQKLIDGLPKVAPNMVVPMRGQTMTTAELVATLQSLVDATQAVMTARAAWREALHDLAKAEAEAGPVVSSVRQMLQTVFDGCAPELAKLGLPLKKPRKPMSPEASALRSAKARSTREARGTKSKKQKAAIHGAVTGVVITPITATGPGDVAAGPTVSVPSSGGESGMITPIAGSSGEGVTSSSVAEASPPGARGLRSAGTEASSAGGGG